MARGDKIVETNAPICLKCDQPMVPGKNDRGEIVAWGCSNELCPNYKETMTCQIIYDILHGK